MNFPTRITFKPVFAFLIAITAIAAPSPAREAPRVGLLRVPNEGIQPQVQIDARGRIHLIYFTGDPAHGDVFYVRSDDGGTTFTKPLQVNSQAGSVIAIGTIRGPRIAVGKGDRVHVAWMGSDKALPKAMGKAAPMLYSRLNDAGDRFEPQRNVIQKYAGLDGGGAVAADNDGIVYVAWHAPERGKTEADRRVWITRSMDEGKSFEVETAASPPDTGACGCCGMNIAAGPNGRVFILYRSATQSVNRDLNLLASENYGKSFNVVNSDPWKIATCAMSTGHFATATDGGVVAAWEAEFQIRLAHLSTDPKSDPKVASVPGKGGDRKHPAIAVNGRGEYIVAWAKGTGWNKGGRVAWQVFDKDGTPQEGGSGIAEGLPAWDVPAVFAVKECGFKVIF